MKSLGLSRRVPAALVSLALMAGLPAAALAQEEWMQEADKVTDESLNPSVALDRKFDLRDDPAFYVTDVKFQNP